MKPTTNKSLDELVNDLNKENANEIYEKANIY